MKTRRISALGLLLGLAAGTLGAQAFSPYAGWESIAEGVQERRLDDDRRVERIALGTAGLRWAVDRLRDEQDRWDRFAGPGDGDLAEEVLRLQWALDALEEFIAEDGEDEVEKALRRARGECDFAFQVDSSAAGGVPQSWVYPFGIRARGAAVWETACGAEALVFTRVAARAAASGVGSFRASPWAATVPAARSVGLCLRRGIGAGCSAQARAQGFAPCRADILSAVVVPELAFYFEIEETAVGCNSTPVYPDPAGY